MMTRLLGLLALLTVIAAPAGAEGREGSPASPATVTRSAADRFRLMGLHVFTAGRLPVRRWPAWRTRDSDAHGHPNAPQSTRTIGGGL